MHVTCYPPASATEVLRYQLCITTIGSLIKAASSNLETKLLLVEKISGAEGD